jgi:hypothetical protein
VRKVLGPLRGSTGGIGYLRGRYNIHALLFLSSIRGLLYQRDVLAGDSTSQHAVA